MKLLYLIIIVLSGFLPCTTKVSEWVLLNAIPADYSLVYYHKEPASEKALQQNTVINKNIAAGNIRFRSVMKENIEQPYYALLYENRLFAKYTDTEQLNGISASPIRDNIAAEIKSGKLCVMLYLKTDNRQKDEKGIAEINKAIASSPFGKIIPVVELSRNNPEEKHFVNMLLNVESDLKDINEPMLFGVFGRFKALEPLVSGGITMENINYMIEFFTADCSCLIKDDLPGTDILYTNKWESPVGALVNAIIDANPSLVHQ